MNDVKVVLRQLHPAMTTGDILLYKHIQCNLAALKNDDATSFLGFERPITQTHTDTIKGLLRPFHGENNKAIILHSSAMYFKVWKFPSPCFKNIFLR